jgi:hypothetical protein
MGRADLAGGSNRTDEPAAYTIAKPTRVIAYEEESAMRKTPYIATIEPYQSRPSEVDRASEHCHCHPLQPNRGGFGRSEWRSVFGQKEVSDMCTPS